MSSNFPMMLIFSWMRTRNQRSSQNGAFLDRRSKIVSSGKREQPVVIEDTVVEYAVIEVVVIEDAAIEDLEECANDGEEISR